MKTDAPKTNAPELYEFTVHDDHVAFDDEVLGAYSTVARELDLSQAAAQKILDKVAPVVHQQNLQRMESIREGWKSQTKSDKEFGGDKFDSNMAVAKKALDKFGSPALRKLLNESGMGDHPDVIRLFFKVGQAISEDRFVAGRGGEGSVDVNDPAVMAKKLYPTHVSA